MLYCNRIIFIQSYCSLCQIIERLQRLMCPLGSWAAASKGLDSNSVQIKVDNMAASAHQDDSECLEVVADNQAWQLIFMHHV